MPDALVYQAMNMLPVRMIDVSKRFDKIVNGEEYSWFSLSLSLTILFSFPLLLDSFYSTKTYQQLSDPKYGLQLMSDQYIVDDVLMELK